MLGLGDRKKHWNKTYRKHRPEEVGWYRERLDDSLALILEAGVDRQASVVDVGGGASTLGRDLLREGFTDVSVLDISAKALDVAKATYGDIASRITWIEGDILEGGLGERPYALWHDRAAFHFLTEEKDRKRYLAVLTEGVPAGGVVVLGVFAPEAPAKCSGLKVSRYDIGQLQAIFQPVADLESYRTSVHTTPAGVDQPYLYARFRRA